ncbi:MAG: hypothetical protein JWM68_3836 [Verrucomicrobiales bacterium]|nr:hypothetical protein [Verrucomicrobiales bacterium]
MEGSLFSAVSKVKTCPYCLFTALPEGFERLETNEAVAVRQALKDLSKRVKRLPQMEQFQTTDGTSDSLLKLMEYRVAEVCDSMRKKDLARSAELAFAEYRISKYYPVLENFTLVTTSRLRATTSIEAALTGNAWTNRDKAFWTYLSGELRRCNGDVEGAVRRLDEAANSSACPIEIARWAKEQAGKARAGDTNSSLPNIKLHRDETEALLAELPAKLPRMLTAISTGQPSSEWLLSGEAKTWTNSRVNEMASKGNADAVNFLVAWLSRLTAKELKERSGSIGHVAWLIAKHRTLVDSALFQKLKFQVPGMRDVMIYAVQAQEIPQSAEKSITRGSDLDAVGEAAVAIATVHQDKAVKPLLRAHLKKSSGYGWVEAVGKFFSDVGTIDDIPALEASAKKFQPDRKKRFDWPDSSMREDIEAAILSIRLREVFAIQ